MSGVLSLLSPFVLHASPFPGCVVCPKSQTVAQEGLTTPGVRSVRSQEALEGQSPSSSLDRVDEAELEEAGS